MKCLNCGREFEPRHVSQKYCSKQCRERYHNRRREELNPGQERARKNAVAKRYYREHCEEIKLKQKIYRLTGEWERGRLST